MGQTSRESEMLGWRRATPRWEDDHVQRLEMLGWIRETPSWAEDPVQSQSWVTREAEEEG